jgi:hypothetical protein
MLRRWKSEIESREHVPQGIWPCRRSVDVQHRSLPDWRTRHPNTALLYAASLKQRVEVRGDDGLNESIVNRIYQVPMKRVGNPRRSGRHDASAQARSSAFKSLKHSFKLEVFQSAQCRKRLPVRPPFAAVDPA